LSASVRLPHAEDAIVELDKIVGYLLSGRHTRGRGKARFFAGFGFKPETADVLRQALLLHARANDVVGSQMSEHGTKYTVEGPLPAPDGRAPVVRSVWIVDKGRQRPRFVTAFPGPR
jgi:hypothetical protein